jgi:uncharacterized protein (DUF302 family)
MKLPFRSNFAWGVYGFLLGIGVTLVFLIFGARALAIQERASPYDFETTVKMIRDNAVQHGWTVSHVDHFEASFAPSVETATGRLEVLELSNPRYESQLLHGRKPHSIAMMPSEVLIFEKGGKVHVAAPNRSLVARLFYYEAFRTMRDVRRDEREILGFLSRT